jgi:hypothetical protein
MTKKLNKRFLLPGLNILALFIFSLGYFSYAGIAAAAPSKPIETSQEMDQAETSDAAPGRVSVARVQSAAQKIVQEEASQNKTGGTAPLLTAMPKSSGRIKKGKNAADSSSSDQNEMRQVRGSSAIQEDDSLSASKAEKGKSPAKKEESF